MNVLHTPCNPLLLTTLVDACSQDTTRLQSAACQLESWETTSGFYSSLLDITLNYNSLNLQIDDQTFTNLRWLAIVYFKNGVERYWRNCAPHAIGELEKSAIRDRLLLRCLLEPVPQIALQLALLIAKMARIDVPKIWPQLLPWLSAEVQCKEEPSKQYNALQVLLHVVKMLASKRLPSDRRLFEQLTNELLSYMATHWTMFLFDVESKLSSVHQGHAINTKDFNVALDHSSICTKILHSLMLHGVHHAERNPVAVEVVQTCLLKLPFLLKCGTILCAAQDAHESKFLLLPRCEKLCYLICKLVNNFQMTHPFAFVPLIVDALHVAIAFTLNDADEFIVHRSGTGVVSEFSSKVVVNLLNLIRQVLLCDHYQSSLALLHRCNINQSISPMNAVQLADKQIEDFFVAADMLPQMLRRLALRYLPLSSEELDEALSDPEGKFAAHETDEEVESAYLWSTRGAAESLISTLLLKYEVALMPCLESLVMDAFSAAFSIPPDDLSMLKCDALLKLCGLAAHHLSAKLHFETLFENHLLPQLLKGNMHQLLQERFLWIIAKWLDVRFCASHQPTLLTLLCEMLSESHSLGVRLAAANCLLHLLSSLELRAENMLGEHDEVAKLLLTRLTDLLGTLVECSARARLLQVITKLICTALTFGQPAAGPSKMSMQLMHLATVDLCFMWNAANATGGSEQISLRHDLLHLWASIVRVLHDEKSSVSIQNFLCRVVLEPCIDIHEDLHHYLLDDALQLWLLVLRNAPTCDEALLRLYRLLEAHMQFCAVEHVSVTMRITEAYLLLAPDIFLRQYGGLLVTLMSQLLRELTESSCLYVLRTAELILATFGLTGASSVLPALSWAVEHLLQSEKDLECSLRDLCLLILTRAILLPSTSSNVLPSLLESVLTTCTNFVQRTPVDCLIQLMESLARRCQSISCCTQRKLGAMALIRLVFIMLATEPNISNELLLEQMLEHAIDFALLVVQQEEDGNLRFDQHDFDLTESDIDAHEMRLRQTKAVRLENSLRASDWFRDELVRHFSHRLNSLEPVLKKRIMQLVQNK